MSPQDWNSLSKQEKAALLKSAGLPAGLSQLSWAGLQKSERKKLEAIKKGKGWHEQQEEVRTEKGIEKKAPLHREVAIKKEASEANNTPMQKPTKKSRLTTQDYLKEKINYGGFVTTRGEAIADMQRTGAPQRNIDAYMMGAECLPRKEESTHIEKAQDYQPKNPPFDPAFEQSEAERMKDEGRREEGTYEDIVVPSDTGDIGEMRAEAGIDETYRKLPEDWLTANRQKEWEMHEVEGYEGNNTKPYNYYIKTYPLATEWVNKHFTKIANTKELEEAVQVYFRGDWNEFISFLQEKQDELTAEKIEKEHRAEERKKEIESKYFATKFRDIDDHNKKECVERTPVQKAHPFGHKGIALFAHKDGKKWKVTEATTGLELARAHQFKGIWRNNTKEEIIQTAKAFIDEKTPEKVSELIKYAADTISRTSPCQ